jgi:hypothetical protein
MIFQRMGKRGVSAREAARRLDADQHIAVLDEKPSTLLVEGDADAINTAARDLDGWKTFALNRIQIPDTRQRVLIRPADDSM